MISRPGSLVITLVLVVVYGCLTGCNRTPFLPRVSGLMTGPGIGLTGQDGRYFSVTGKFAVIYATDRPSVFFGAVESGATDLTLDTWVIPWVIIDHTGGGAEKLLQAESSSMGHIVEVDFQLAATTGQNSTGQNSTVDPSVSVEWAVDCSRTPAVIRYFRFNSQEIDLSRGALLFLQRNDQGELVLEQRAWKGTFTENLSGKKTGSYYITVEERSQSIADAILDELGY